MTQLLTVSKDYIQLPRKHALSIVILIPGVDHNHERTTINKVHIKQLHSATTFNIISDIFILSSIKL